MTDVDSTIVGFLHEVITLRYNVRKIFPPNVSFIKLEIDPSIDSLYTK